MIAGFSRSLVVGMATLALAAGVSLAQAQQPTIQPEPALQPEPTIQPEPAPADQVAPDRARQQRGQLRDEITQLLVAANRDEIELSRFGMDRAQTQQVREYSQRMIKEHQDFINQIQQVAGAGAPGTAPGAPGVGPAAPGVAPAPGARRVGDRGQAAQLVQVLEQVGNRQVELTQQELANRQGIEFDQAYMGSQVAAHIAMLAALETFGNRTTGQLQQVIRQGAQTTRQHLNEAQAIMRQLEQQAARQAGAPKEAIPR